MAGDLEGDKAYKLSIIKNFLSINNGKKIKTIIEIGSFRGIITELIHSVFPEASIYGYEAIPFLAEEAKFRTEHISNIHINCAAVTYERHKDLFLYYNKKNIGGSFISEEIDLSKKEFKWTKLQHQFLYKNNPHHYIKKKYTGALITMDEIISFVLKKEQIEEIDYIKIDCEGGEIGIFDNLLLENLKKVRFISGEFHGANPFFYILKDKVEASHRIHIKGNRRLGTFFFVRKNERDNFILNERFYNNIPFDENKSTIKSYEIKEKYKIN